jgi:predicted transcriptional regulator
VSKQRLSVAEAAELLGISTEAVRMRIKRGQLDCEKQRGRVFVWLDSEQLDGQTEYQPRALKSEMHRRRGDLQEELEAERQAHAQTRRLLMLALLALERLKGVEDPQEEEPPSEP